MSDKYRFFPPHVEDFGSIAFSDPWLPSGESYSIIGAPSGTAISASEIELQVSGLKGYVKPGRSITDRTQSEEFMVYGAQEKIAADLAYMLKLPVAPCVLAKPLDENSLVSVVTISISSLFQGRKFSERGSMPEVDPAETIRIASAMSVFHTFIRDADHSSNDGNQLIDVISEPYPQTAFCFYDYSHALCYGWSIDNPVAPDQSQGRVSGFDSSIQAANIDIVEVSKIVGKIEALSDSQISDIICRIPTDMMKDNMKHCLTAYLIKRRSILRTIMGLTP